MKIFGLSGTYTAILFDMDSTLYSHPEYARLQIDLLIQKLAGLRGVSFETMNNEISIFRNKWAGEHNGQQISLGNTFINFGISIEESIHWREELYTPELFLSEDIDLRRALERLGSGFNLAVVTNNPVSVAKRTLRALGVEDLFSAVVGLDTCGVSKPHREPFLKAAALCGAAAGACVSVGDRYDIDIALPLELGMGGVLVTGVNDVYTLPELLGGGNHEA